MPEPKNIEGTYKIYHMSGCVTALERNQPLVLLPAGYNKPQTWEVKRVGDDKFVIHLKDKSEGITYMDYPFAASPVSLGHPRQFKIYTLGEDLKQNDRDENYASTGSRFSFNQHNISHRK